MVFPRCLATTFGGGVFRYRFCSYCAPTAKTVPMVSSRTITVRKLLANLPKLITILIIVAVIMAPDIRSSAIQMNGVSIRSIASDGNTNNAMKHIMKSSQSASSCSSFSENHHIFVSMLCGFWGDAVVDVLIS